MLTSTPLMFKKVISVTFSSHFLIEPGLTGHMRMARMAASC